MLFQIKNRWSGEVIFETEAVSIKVAVEMAIKSNANLSEANLSWADLSNANLSWADLSWADQHFIRDDFWAVLASAPFEIEGLRQALIEGKVDGSTYEGECACLIGTIANVRGVSRHNLGALKPNSSRPAERFFMGIKKGDKPETNVNSKLALQWLDEFVSNMKSAFVNKS